MGERKLREGKRENKRKRESKRERGGEKDRERDEKEKRTGARIALSVHGSAWSLDNDLLCISGRGYHS